MFNYQNDELRSVFDNTSILRKPISGIVSGYHDISYILVSPDDENASHAIEINGKIRVSPRFIISPTMLQETFGDVFESGTFDQSIEGRLFSFAYAGKKNVKISSEYLNIKHTEINVQEHLNTIQENLYREENTRTGLIFAPKFQYYPVSIDRFISEILDREFRA
jgi:hypothetical protein